MGNSQGDPSSSASSENPHRPMRPAADPHLPTQAHLRHHHTTTFSEPRDPQLTPHDQAHLEALHRTLDVLLSPSTSTSGVTSLLTTFRRHLDTPHYLLPIALHQRISTLTRKLRITATALAHADRVNTRLTHLHATLVLQEQQQQQPPFPANSQRRRQMLRATASVRVCRPLAQRLAEVLGGAEQYANVVDVGVLAEIVRLGRAAEVEAGALERRLVVVRRVLDGFWGRERQGRGEVLWRVFVKEAEVRVGAVNLWAVEEANRVWVVGAVGRGEEGGWV
ncbi:hypothetical protein P167DRAFT_546597 [Morchella conica CCBAS932]|uniref:Uncharacterized protein n=1 Tax=Morchella conica CCBAS932 TaxID=1392247 RepID=A0A3N4KL28_9PEZI|nr:hypothetical protein P167DRAFT_546597 [Morchella conica CCBAS932]